MCEQAFLNNPWDVGAARVAAEAADQMGLTALAEWYVESVQAVAKDAEFFRFAAGVHGKSKTPYLYAGAAALVMVGVSFAPTLWGKLRRRKK